jgi:hypothetical protein
MKWFNAGLFALALVWSANGGGNDYRVSDPVQHDNLTVFSIHGPSRPEGKLLTLGDAIAQHKVIVYETKQVNELAIENVSKDEDVFIQSGDIVKGGQQDRTLKEDMILGANSGRVNIDAFCVEAGRWTRRGQEAAGTFGSSSAMVATKELKNAVRASADQSEVWSQVRQAQGKLAASTAEPVTAAASPTSLMMTMETPVVARSTQGYVKALSGIADGQNDVIGYAFAINGKLNSAEIYASHELFVKMWPKLLQANAVEAVANYRRDAKFAQPSADAVKAMLAAAKTGKVSERQAASRTKVLVTEADAVTSYETRDRLRGDAWIHRSYMTK